LIFEPPQLNPLRSFSSKNLTGQAKAPQYDILNRKAAKGAKGYIYFLIGTPVPSSGATPVKWALPFTTVSR